MAGTNNPFDFDSIFELASRHSFLTTTGTSTGEAKYSWVRGLPACPNCKIDVTDKKYWCDGCGYGKEKAHSKKPPKIAGYDYVINDDFPKGMYIRKPDRKLFSTVIIEDYKKQMIVEALSIIEHQKLIFEKWGFGEIIEKGKGVSLLFYGPPGTGKTLMGEAIAQYTGRHLEVITASEILDKYVGESERRIAQIFRTGGDKVLLFDECDSLLRDRGRARASWEVSQVNVLLHELEEFQGVSIFTTNHTKHLDAAMDRRIALKVHFELPDAELRKRIWQRMFPEKAPLAKDVNWDLLAEFPISGGYVKNAVLRAARIAAFRESKEITFSIIKEALRQELSALNDYDDSRGENQGKPKEQAQAKVELKEEDA
jgi:SpoVK/Ycf46/Vps4 family AAA+-type ATPase